MKTEELIIQEYRRSATQLAASLPSGLVKELLELENEMLSSSSLLGIELKQARQQMEAVRWQIVSTWQDKQAA